MGLLLEDITQAAQMGGAGPAGAAGDQVMDRIMQRWLQTKYPTMASPTYGTPGINPYATPPFNPNSPIDTSTLDALSAQNKADEGLADKFLRPVFGKLGGIGNVGNKALDVLGEVQGAARASALRGGLGAIAPNFSRGVREAANMETDRAYKRAMTERIRKMSAGGVSGPDIGTYNPRDYTVESFAKFIKSGDPADLERYEAPKSIKLIRRADGSVVAVDAITSEPISEPITPEEAVSGAVTAKTATTQAEEQTKVDVRNQNTLPEEIAQDQEFIDRAQKFVDMLKNNELETGPIAGRLPALSTNAQLFEAFSGENIIQSISSATFGALSEGERQFIKSTNPNRTLTEEANIDIIQRKIDMIKRAQNRAREKLGQEPVKNTTPTGRTATNPDTGEKVREMSDGTWQPM